MKKIIIAPDSYKGTISSIEVCGIIESAVKKILPDTQVVKLPIADGGEGTVDAFLAAAGGRKLTATVQDPLFREIPSFYGILPDGRTAVIEMAAASGLPLVEQEKNPSLTTTYGTGQLILEALNQGCRRIILGIGGSATNDGGVGMAAALGARFLDEAGNDIPPTGGGLGSLASIDVSGLDKRIAACEFITACDVDNPLYGKEGAAYVFGPQKGADEELVRLLDANLRRYAEVLLRDLDVDAQAIPGSGAAGGLGAGLLAFTGARLQSGINVMLDTVGFETLARDASLVITGEGKIDGQSLRGKVPVGVAKRASAMSLPVVVIAGDAGPDTEALYDVGISAIFSTNRRAVPFEIAKLSCKEDLYQTAESVIRLARLLTHN